MRVLQQQDVVLAGLPPTAPRVDPKRRIERGLTTDKLGDEVGFYEIEIKRLENEPEHIESWRLEFVQRLSDSLGIPLPILLGVKCSQCGR